MSGALDLHRAAQDILAAQPATQLFFLLDHGGLPGLQRRLAHDQAQWASLFDGSRQESALSVAPLLVHAGSAGAVRLSRSLLAWLAEHGTYSSSIILLTSPHDLATLRARLAARLDLKLSQNMDALLRFFDPRVLASLIRILPAAQATPFFSPADSWCYVDRAGKLVSVPTAFDHHERFYPPLVLAESEEFALLAACEIDQVLHLLRETVPIALSALPLSAQPAFVERAIAMAKMKGIDSVFKCSLFAALCLVQGSALMEGAPGQNFLDALTADEEDLLEKMGQFEVDAS
jgi:hypothetical protein